jgi:DNA-binding CsgD family transcriptional regulator
MLTPREQEVLALIREGLTNEQIGARLGISDHGAKYHIGEILSKLGVSSRQEAARWSRPQRVAPSLVGLLPRHFAVGALVIAGVGLMLLAAGVLLMNERSRDAATGAGQQQQKEEGLAPPPGLDDGPIRRIAYVEVQGDEADI